MKYILIIAFLVFLIIIGPILTIWALNTLFPALAIPYTIETWVAALIIAGLLKSKVSVDK